MPLAHATRLGLTARFHVTVHAQEVANLGSWQSCKGLAVQFTMEKVKEGGTNDHLVYLPIRTEYKPIKLQRALNRADSTAVQSWLRKCSNEMKGSNATITLCDAHGQQVATWELRNVYPSQWSGPDLDGNGKTIAIETLELVHEGFL